MFRLRNQVLFEKVYHVLGQIKCETSKQVTHLKHIMVSSRKSLLPNLVTQINFMQIFQSQANTTLKEPYHKTYWNTYGHTYVQRSSMHMYIKKAYSSKVASLLVLCFCCCDKHNLFFIVSVFWHLIFLLNWTGV